MKLWMHDWAPSPQTHNIIAASQCFNPQKPVLLAHCGSRDCSASQLWAGSPTIATPLAWVLMGVLLVLHVCPWVLIHMFDSHLPPDHWFSHTMDLYRLEKGVVTSKLPIMHDEQSNYWTKNILSNNSTLIIDLQFQVLVHCWEWGPSLFTSGRYSRHFLYQLHHFFTCEKLGEINLLQTGLSEWILHCYTFYISMT